MVPAGHKAPGHGERAFQTRPPQVQAILEHALLEAESVARNQVLQVDPAPEPAAAEVSNVKRFPSQLTSQDAILNVDRLPRFPHQLRCREWCRFRWLTDDAFQGEIGGVGL